MTRSPVSIALAAIAAVFIVLGRVNRETSWGNLELLAGFTLLVVAAAFTLRRTRS